MIESDSKDIYNKSFVINGVHLNFLLIKEF